MDFTQFKNPFSQSTSGQGMSPGAVVDYAGYVGTMGNMYRNAFSKPQAYESSDAPMIDQDNPTLDTSWYMKDMANIGQDERDANRLVGRNALQGASMGAKAGGSVGGAVAGPLGAALGAVGLGLQGALYGSIAGAFGKKRALERVKKERADAREEFNQYASGITSALGNNQREEYAQNRLQQLSGGYGVPRSFTSLI